MLEVLAAARAEASPSAEYYEDRQPELGTRFADELERVLARIEDAPLTGGLWELDGFPPGVREMLLRSFRHSVVYVTEPKLVVVAIRHMSRSPLYWIDRIRDL